MRKKLTAGDIVKKVHRRRKREKGILIDENTLELTIKGSSRTLFEVAQFMKMIESASQRNIEGWYGIKLNKDSGNIAVYGLPQEMHYDIRSNRYWVHYTTTTV